MRMTRGVRLLGVALLVLLLGGVDELGIGSGRFGCGGVMAQMNRDGGKEDEKSGLPPSDGAEKQAPKEEEEEKPQTDTRSSLSNRDLSAENQQLRADNAQLTETNQVLVAKDEEYKKRVVELELEVQRLRADCAERPSPDAGKQELPPREEHADLAEKLTQCMEDLTASRHREELLQAQVTSLTAIAAEREKQNLTPEQKRQLATYVPLTTANSALQKRVDELVAENTVTKAALESLQEAHDDLVALHDTDRGICRALGAEKQTAEEELDTLQSQKTSLAQQLTACEAAKDALQQVYDDLLKQTDQQQARIAALEAAVSQNSKEVLAALSTDELVSANTVCESEKADLSSEITKVRDEMKQLRATHETTVSELAEAKQELSMLQSNKTLLESEKSNCEAAKDALQQVYDDLLKQTDQQQARIAALEAAVSQNSKEALIASSEANVIIPGMETAALQPPCSKEVELAAKKRIASMVYAIQVMTNDERHNVIRKHDETGRLQQELRDLDASYALALQKVQRHKRNEMITGIVLGLVFPLLALLGVLLYLYWQRRRSDVLSSADAAATSSLMDQETELVNRRTGSCPDEDHNGLRNSLTETGEGGAFEDICL